MCEEAIEELARGKRIWNSAWLDSQKKVRSRLVVNQVRNAKTCLRPHTPLAAMRFHFVACCVSWSWLLMAFLQAAIEEEVFVRPPKNTRKDKAIWKLLKAMYGTQVAVSCWQRLVRETLCDGHWRVLTSVLCVANNEKEDSLVFFFTETISLRRVIKRLSAEYAALFWFFTHQGPATSSEVGVFFFFFGIFCSFEFSRDRHCHWDT